MRTPHGLELVILALAAFRLVRLIGWDTITRPLRERICALSERDGHEYVGKRQPRPWLQEWIHCPWCMGAYVTGAVWISWLVWPHFTMGVATLLALMALVGLISKNLDP